MSTYCTITDAGNTYNIEDLKNSLKPGGTKEYKGRIYTLGADTKQLIVDDAKAKSQITFNGVAMPPIPINAYKCGLTHRCTLKHTMRYIIYQCWFYV